MIRALIFDFDGTILETEGPEFASWCEIYREHGVELPFEVWGAGIGSPADHFDPFRYLERLTGRSVDRDSVGRRRSERHRELVEREEVRPGVRDLIRDAHRLGLKLAVASNSPRQWVAGHLTRLGMRDAFEIVRTGDDVQNVKPDPELYWSALSGLNLVADEAVAIEDSPSGARAAARAGIFCVVVPNPLTERLVFADVDMKLERLADVRLEDLLRSAHAVG